MRFTPMRAQLIKQCKISRAGGCFATVPAPSRVGDRRPKLAVRGRRGDPPTIGFVTTGATLFVTIADARSRRPATRSPTAGRPHEPAARASALATTTQCHVVQVPSRTDVQWTRINALHGLPGRGTTAVGATHDEGTVASAARLLILLRVIPTPRLRLNACISGGR